MNLLGRRTFSRCAIRAFSDGKSTTHEAVDESPLEPNKDMNEESGGLKDTNKETGESKDPNKETGEPTGTNKETAESKDPNVESGGFTIRRVANKVDSEPDKLSFSYRSARGSNTRRNGNEYTKRGANDMYTNGTGTSFSRVNSKGHDINPTELEIPWGEAGETEVEDLDFEGFGFNEPREKPNANDYHEEADEIQTVTRKSDPRQNRNSTITPLEKIAFQKIFSDIFSRAQPATPYGMDGLLDKEPMESSGEVKSRTENARESLGKIVHLATQSRPQEEIEAAVNRYPPTLRPAAARAMGLTSQRPQSVKVKAETEAQEENATIEPSVDDDKLEMLRKPERDRVEGLMRSATTDFELWTIMQKEVFPLISKLGLEEAPEEEEAPLKKKRGKKTSQKGPAQDNLRQAPLALVSPVEEMSPLEFYGPLYPSYLLLGLRLLDRSFDRPSPLTLSILPEIKSLGIISHVLGGPTQLYNELLLIHWYRYDDFRGVLRLLNEMEQFGLNWDRETWDIVDNITRLQKAVRDGDRGVALKALWTLPEFAPGRFKPWKNKIEQTLAEGRPQDVRQLSY